MDALEKAKLDAEEALIMGILQIARVNRPRPKETPRIVDTKCCGTITRCPEDQCKPEHVWATGGKCFKCRWVYEMMPGEQVFPISEEEMRLAHE